MLRGLKTATRGYRAQGFDWRGLLLFAIFVVTVMLACEQARHLEIEAVLPTCAFGTTSVLSLVLLRLHEREMPNPLFPPKLWGEPMIRRSTLVAACHGAAMVSLLTFLPIYLQVVRGLTASKAELL
jgi:hypothetical protein